MKRTFIDIYNLVLGAVVLVLNKFRYAVFGYNEPRDFSSANMERAISYDKYVVSSWLKQLFVYADVKDENFLQDKTVLEIGPGPDLGTGIILLSKGIGRYIAVDRNKLIAADSENFYDNLLKNLELGEEKISKEKKESLQVEINNLHAGKSEKLQYIQTQKDNLAFLEREKIDIIFSQAAFEHFSDTEKMIAELSGISQTGTVLLTEIDLMTHTRILRKCDPLNIYRFSDAFYRLVSFSGIPNRVRPHEYMKLLEKNGWGKISLIPLITCDKEELRRISLAKRFRHKENQMEILSCILIATKA